MKNKIYLNKNTSIDIPKAIQSRMVILANSGAGKSYAIRKFCEGAVTQVQTIIIDPEGEFSSLREKYDFILAGKNADVPAEVRSAGLLATRLLELGKSAVIDLYELHPQDRQRFVKLFFDAMLNAPKELYHPVFIVLDEAHEFAPEGKPSEATYSVEAMASRGRKRGFCLIPASQRISKLSKNVSAECNNKLIGRASQDIDMKRAGDELGFSKAEMVQLRQLKPGEFFIFGPAISDEVAKIKIGEVNTSHAKVSYGKAKVPPSSAVIKKILSEIKDLPKEAEQEAKTVTELKKENKDLKQMNANLLKHPFQKDLTEEDIGKIIAPYMTLLQKKHSEEIEKWDKYASAVWMTCFNNINSALQSLNAVKNDYPKKSENLTKIVYKKEYAVAARKEIPTVSHPSGLNVAHQQDFIEGAMSQFEGSLAKGEMAVLNAIAQDPEGITTEHLAILTGYKQTSRRVYLQKLIQGRYIKKAGDVYCSTPEGREALGNSFKPLPIGKDLLQHYLQTLPEGEKKILNAFLNGKDYALHKDSLPDITGYKTTSIRVYLQKLMARKIDNVGPQTYQINEKLTS